MSAVIVVMDTPPWESNPERQDRLTRRSGLSLSTAGLCLRGPCAGFGFAQSHLALDALTLEIGFHLLLCKPGLPFLWSEPIPLELHKTLRSVGIFFRHPTVGHANPPQGLLSLLAAGVDGYRALECSVRLSGEPVVTRPQAERKPAGRIFRGEPLCAVPIRAEGAGAGNDAVDRCERQSDATWTDLDRDARGCARDDLAPEAAAALEHDLVRPRRHR